MKITKKEFNSLTGEITITEHDETAQEQAERETFEAAAVAKAEVLAAEEAAKVAAQAKLTALGLTVEDLQALGL